MILSDEEKALLDGREGPARQKAMELLVRYGEALGAEKLVDTNNVCTGVVGAQPFKREFASKMASIDEVFSVFHLDSSTPLRIPHAKAFTCRLIESLDPDYWEIQGVSRDIYEMFRKNEAFCARVGIQLVNTCAPYLVGNVPVKGEHCAWMESSAVIYCNSVLGARTNVEGAESAGAAMLVGKIPYWGYHLDENRKGSHLVEVELEPESVMDWNLMGYYVGEWVQEHVPVFRGMQRGPGLIALKHFGAAAASSGGVEMYHLVGFTPEAFTVEQAFGGTKPKETLKYGKDERKIAYENLTSAKEPNVDFVMLGCPHYSLEQVWRVSRLLEKKRISPHTQLWIFTPRALKSAATRMGYTEIIEKAGAYLMCDTCPALGHVYPQGTKVAATDSAKQAHYMPAALGFETWFGSMEECIGAAIKGKWRGGLS